MARVVREDTRLHIDRYLLLLLYFFKMNAHPDYTVERVLFYFSLFFSFNLHYIEAEEEEKEFIIYNTRARVSISRLYDTVLPRL